MRAPSARVLFNRADLYIGAPTQDNEGGPQWVYPVVPSMAQVACSVQYQETAQDEDNGRLTNLNTYWVVFAFPVEFLGRGKIIWTDVSPNRILFSDGSPPSEAGRQGQFTVRAIEKL